MSEDLVARGRAVVTSHEAYVQAGNLAAIMTNMAPDIVVMVPDSPLIEGAAACRAMYAALLEIGRWKFEHDYHGAHAEGAFVFLHGVARGSLTTPDGLSQPVSNNFQITLKLNRDNRLEAWRVGFAPDGG